MCGAVVLLTLYAEKLHGGSLAGALNAFALCCLKMTVLFLVKTGDSLKQSHINGNRLCGI